MTDGLCDYCAAIASKCRYCRAANDAHISAKFRAVVEKAKELEAAIDPDELDGWKGKAKAYGDHVALVEGLAEAGEDWEP